MTRPPATAAAKRSNWLMLTFHFCESHSMGTSGMPSSSPCGCEPHRIWDTPSSTKVSPMVAMKSVMGGWLVSGRSTMRSVAMPSKTMRAAVAASASQKFHPISSSDTKVSAAKNTIEPCAKLNTPEAL